jgi:hypothetical protein
MRSSCTTIAFHNIKTCGLQREVLPAVQKQTY